MSQYSSAGGGGGYIHNSSPFASSQSPGGEGKNRSDISHSLRPVTVRQIHRATQSHHDADWKLDGHDLGQIAVVAQIRTINAQNINTTFSLDDGTGEIEARLWSANEKSNDDEGDGSWRGIRENDYVRISGYLRHYQNKTFYSANHIIKCTDPYEVYFHILEAIFVTQLLEKGVPPTKGNLATMPAQSTSDYQVSSKASAVIHDERYSHLPVLHQTIIKFFQDHPPGPTGYRVENFVGSLPVPQGLAMPEQASLICTALGELLEQGMLYTTENDEMYALCD